MAKKGHVRDEMSREKKVILSEMEMPKKWYNIQADLPKPLEAALNPQTKESLAAEDLSAIFPMSLIEQEVSTQRWIDIPEEVLEVYSKWRPAPLIRADRLEKLLDTPAKIYYKYEGVSGAGSHKLNTAVPQAYYNKLHNVKRLSTETGAGQWGSALAIACAFFDLKCTVYMVKVSYESKPYRRSLMQVYGAEVFASPSNRTEAGREILAKDPNSLGSLGMAISEAVEDAVNHDDTNYALGSVLNHVLLHQTVIGLETKAQFEKIGDYPDVVIGCCGGGSNFGGLAFPFVKDKIDGRNIQLVGVEPCACPTLTKGKFAYDFGDTAKLTPILKMHTLGHNFVPPGIHAGGLRYHGMSPLISHVLDLGLIEARAVGQLNVFDAALKFARTEGILPAPESAHAIRGAIDEALKCKETGEEKTIVFGLSGHGHFDLSAYDLYLAGSLEDYEYPEEKINESLAELNGLLSL